MGTRGFVTFVADGVEKTAYNHWDSYPSELGANVLGWLRQLRLSEEACCAGFSAGGGCSTHHRETVESLRAKVRALRVVSDDEVPTEDDIQRLIGFADSGVRTGDPTDWYVLLRHTQGNPAAMLSAGVIEDASEFPRDSLSAEWGYVVDLDGATFEVYRGFQGKRHDLGRFADREGTGSGYWPVALVTSWPLDDLPTEDGFHARLNPNDDDED